MARQKKILIAERDKEPEHREVDSIESELRKIAREIKRGELTVPLNLSFEGPSGLHFNIVIEDEEAAGEMTSFGFMF
jgi:hypothetical protein